MSDRWEVEILSGFSLCYGVSLVLSMVWAFNKRLPYMEIILGSMGIQILISPFLEFYYFHNQIFGVMDIQELKYFGFVTYAILALEFGILLLTKQSSDYFVFCKMQENAIVYERIGIQLIWIGYAFHIFHSLPMGIGFSFVFKSISYLRFVGFFYLLCCSSKKTKLYSLIVFVPFVLETFRNAIFIELLIIGLSSTAFILLKKRFPSYITLTLVIFAISSAVLMQSVKHEYRKMIWSGEDASLVKMMYEKQKSLDSEQIRHIGAFFNVRVNQGWILADVITYSQAKKYEYNGEFIKNEALGILLPRFIHPNKPVVGDHKKFDHFVGWHLADNTSMNLGLLGDAYGNFGRIGGIVFSLFFGLCIGFGHRKLQFGLNKYPDLLCWTPLLYNYLIRSGNEFYIITNWYVKTGIITLIFFYFFRKRLIKQSGQANNGVSQPSPIAP